MLNRVALGLVMLLVGVVAAWGLSRMLGASSAERSALALMEQTWQPAGRNAFAAFWLADFPVPADERERVLAEDVARFRASPPGDGGEEGSAGSFVSIAATRWPSDAPEWSADLQFCHGSEACLAKVRADLAEYSALVEASAARIARIEAITDGDHVRSTFPAHLFAPFPPLKLLYEPATAYAVRFARGEHLPALASTCARIADLRRLRTQTDMLVVAMVADAYAAQGYARLAADMMAEMPLDAPLPDECRQAFDPLQPADTSLCQAMRGEFALRTQAVDITLDDAKKSGTNIDLIFDPAGTRAMLATELAAYCEADNIARLAADEPMPATGEFRMLRLPCIANWMGCVVAGAAHGLADYGERVRDHAALLRLMGGLVWLREHPEVLAQGAGLIDALPSHSLAPAHPLELDEQARAIRLPLIAAQYAESPSWLIPLPGSRLAGD